MGLKKEPMQSRYPLISVIVPMMNEEQNIQPFFASLKKVTKPLKYRFELILVDDGSVDGSVPCAKRLKSTDSIDVKTICLSRNFGKEVATSAGIHEAKGEAAIMLDADLQHPIDIMPQFIKKWEEGNDVVIGVRKEAGHDNAVKKMGSNLFYKIMNSISSTEIIPHSTDYRMIDRQVMDAFSAFTERERITRGLIDWLGFERTTIEFEPAERQHGEASYSLRKLIKLAVASFTGHSLFPLKLAGYVGVAFMIFFGLFGLAIYIENYIMGDPLGLSISGTAMLAVLLLFAIGIVLASLGLVSLYIANIHAEVTNRPLYVIRRDRK